MINISDIYAFFGIAVVAVVALWDRPRQLVVVEQHPLKRSQALEQLVKTTRVPKYRCFLPHVTTIRPEV